MKHRILSMAAGFCAAMIVTGCGVNYGNTQQPESQPVSLHIAKQQSEASVAETEEKGQALSEKKAVPSDGRTAAETQTEAVTEAETEAAAATEAETEAAAVTAADTEAAAETETETEAAAATEAETEAAAETEAVTETEAAAETEAATETEKKIVRLSFAKPQTEEEAEAKAETETEAGAETESEAATESAGLKKGKALEKGDCIGITAPAGSVDDQDFHQAVMFLRSLGYRVKVAKSCLMAEKGFAGDDRQRADDLNEMFADDSVDAILCLRGGYGCARILDYLDYAMISEHPKLLIGYSDITALHIALQERCGLVTVHGPMASSFRSIYSDYLQQQFQAIELDAFLEEERELPLTELDLSQADFTDTRMAYTVSQFREGLSKSEPIGEITLPEGKTLTAVIPGSAKGRIIGGNLSLLASLAGTEYELQADHAILFVEEVGEPAYKIDRMLRQLWENGLFDRIDGILIGDMSDNRDDETLSVQSVCEEYARLAGKPCIQGVPAGHGTDNMFLPFGVMAQMTAKEDGSAQLEILESALVR